MNSVFKKIKNIVAATLLLTLSTAQIIYPYRIYAEDTVDAPAPIEIDPAPAEEEPAPATDEPVPSTDEPAPATDEPAPAQDEPAPEPTVETTTEEPSTSTDSTATSTEESNLTEAATSTPLSTSSSTPSVISTSTSTTTLTSSATSTPADVSTSTEPSTNSSNTGADSASSTGSPTIVTGQSVALANILNLVNTNFINADGMILFSSFWNPVNGTIDFRNNGTSSCSTLPCTSGDHVQINFLNDATINNFILLQATSGENSIDGGANSTINTGNAYAGLNLINLANNNFVDSNYLLVTLNAFQGINGDIVFPSLTDFFTSLVSNSMTPNTLNITNNAAVENNISATTSTGDNTVEGAASSTIATGNAHSNSNVFNQLNTTLVGGSNISILFRIHGNWVGDVFGAPQGLSWVRGDDGSIYLFDTKSASSTGAGSNSGTSVGAEGTNNALIKNNISVIALTGENRIGGASSALIQTGNAYAGANVVNVANTNVVGRNWIMAVINIFGDFMGNIAFGRPDLWVGEQVSVPSQIKNDSELTYKFSVINNGDSESTNTRLVDDFDNEHLDILESSFPYSIDGNGNIAWEIGTIPPKMATEITYKARVKNAGSETNITNTVLVTGRETDNNTADNSDTATLVTEKSGSGRNWGAERAASKAAEIAVAEKVELKVTRTTLVSSLDNDIRNARQQLIITNPSAKKMSNAVLQDFLHDSRGKLVHHEIWEFGDIEPYEEITIGYDIEFATSAPEGIYNFTTELNSTNNKQLFENNGLIFVSFNVIEVTSKNLGIVKGITSEEATTTDEALLPLPEFDLYSASTSEIYSAPKPTSKSKPPMFIIVALATLMSIYTKQNSTRKAS